MSAIDFVSLGLKKNYTFDQLVVGPHNQMAAAASLQVAKSLGEAYNPLFLFGPPGVGKTHIMHAIAHMALSQSGELKVKYLSAERFVNDIISAISEDNIMAVRQHYSSLDLFMIDDVQFLVESRATQNEFLHIFNNMHQNNRQVILASDRPPNQLMAFDKTIRSRLEWGLAADVKIPDLATRVEIMRLKQRNFGLQLSDEALKFVAEYLHSNVRELEGFLKRLNAYITLSHQELTMGLIQNIINEILPQSQPSIDPGQGAPPRTQHVIKEAMEMLKPPAPIQESVVMPPLHVPAVAAGSVIPPVAPANGSNGNGHKHDLPQATSATPVTQPTAPAPTAPSAMPPVAPSDVSDKTSPVNPVPPPPVVQPPKAPPVYQKQIFVPPTVSDEPTPDPSNLAQTETDTASVDALAVPDEEVGELPPGHKEVVAVFFYPSQCETQLNTVIRKFQEVIRKHKLKFRLKRVASHAYDHKTKLNYSTFVEVCKQNRVPVAIVIGPPSDGVVTEQEFFDLLSVTLDVQGVSLQMVGWGEIDKDYRYLNLSLDIALVRGR